MRQIVIVTLLLANAAVADTRTVIGAFGPVEVPLEPRRIVSLHDASITHPLIELGAPVVGSHGRPNPGGEPYLRGFEDFSGEGFSEHNIAFLGAYNQLDAEQIAAIEPDLIIAPPWQKEAIPGLARIAPVVTIPWSEKSSLEAYRLIAEAAGRQERFEQMLADYQQRVMHVSEWVGHPERIRVAMLQAWDGEITAYREYGAFSQVVNDIGFGLPDIIRAIPGQSMTFSPELLPDFDADFVFDTFEPNFGDTPTGPAARLEQALPGWCQRLFACRHRQYVVLERSKVMGESFAAYHYMLDQLTTHIAGRGYRLNDSGDREHAP